MTETAPASPADPLVSTAWLAHQLRAVTLLDATVVMTTPLFDGDYGAESGYQRWLTAHIPTSRHADLLGDLSDHGKPYHFALPPADALARALEKLGVSSDRPVVVYDSDGGLWAARLWWMVRWLGVEAFVLDGGWQAWQAEGRAVENGPAVAIIPGHIDAAPRPGFWYDKDQVRDVLRGDAPGVLLNALAPAAFAGTAPTRYSRRGHIPTSRNLPARELVGSDGLFKRKDELSPLVETALSGTNGPVLTYCGGGISAAGIVLALVRLGRSDVGIYDGSLEEWSADPELPLVTLP